MKTTLSVAAIAVAAATSAQAGGIDRSGQGIGILFEQGRTAELSFGVVKPEMTGTDRAPFTGRTGNVVDTFGALDLGYKADINAQLSYALILDQPFAADIAYPVAGGSDWLGGTRAKADTTALTGLLRYKFDESFSAHGGLRLQQAKAGLTLNGAAYGGLAGYDIELDRDLAMGWVAGVAWERPDIAARISLTYFSEIEHNFDTREYMGTTQVAAGKTAVKTPRAVNLDFQTGVAADTLVFGQIRWVKWSEFQLNPAWFYPVGGGLIAVDDTTTYTLGVGRKFNETWSGAFSMTYEDPGRRNVSPLAPTTGRVGATLAAIYTHENMKITTGVNYTRLGNATAAPGGAPRTDFRDSDALGIGVKVGFAF